MRIHTGEKPHVCPECTEDFSGAFNKFLGEVYEGMAAQEKKQDLLDKDVDKLKDWWREAIKKLGLKTDVPKYFFDPENQRLNWYNYVPMLNWNPDTQKVTITRLIYSQFLEARETGHQKKDYPDPFAVPTARRFPAKESLSLRERAEQIADEKLTGVHVCTIYY